MVDLEHLLVGLTAKGTSFALKMQEIWNAGVQ